MPLPLSKRIYDWEVEELFTNNRSIWSTAHKIQQENPNLYKLILIAKKYEQEEVSASYCLGAAIIYSLLREAAKPNKLPVVSDATVDSTIVSFFSANKTAQSVEMYKKMFNDETLALCLLYVIETDKLSEIEKDWVAKAFAQFYGLLYRQAEADDMEELFS